MIRGDMLYFPHLQINIVDIEPIVRQNRDIITQVDHQCHHLNNDRVLFSQMKPLLSKTEKVIYLPGDPQRKAFDEQWRLAGGDPKEMEGQTIEIDDNEIKKVSIFTQLIWIIS